MKNSETKGESDENSVCIPTSFLFKIWSISFLFCIMIIKDILWSPGVEPSSEQMLHFLFRGVVIGTPKAHDTKGDDRFLFLLF